MAIVLISSDYSPLRTFQQNPRIVTDNIINRPTTTKLLINEPTEAHSADDCY